MKTMYPAMVNSPEALTRGVISASAVSFEVSDSGIFTSLPLPYPITLGKGVTSETVLLKGVTGDTLTVERGFQGAPRAFEAGTSVSRNYTAWDHDAFVANILELNDNLNGISGAFALKRKDVLVVGHINSGYSEEEVDFLCTGEKDEEIINHAISVLPENGSVILLEGTYRLKGSILIDRPNITLESLGQKAVLERAFTDEEANAMIFVTGEKAVIKNLVLKGDGSESGGVLSCGVLLSDGTGHTVEGCCFENHVYAVCIHFQSTGSEITKNSVGSCKAGITIFGSGGNSVRDNVIKGCTEGICVCETASKPSNLFIGNVITGGVYGFLLDAGCNCVINGNIAAENDRSIYFDSGSNLNLITGNNFCQFNISGIFLSGCRGNLITSNTIYRGNGDAADYNAEQFTFRLEQYANSYNHVNGNMILGKATSDLIGGTSNTFVQNKSS